MIKHEHSLTMLWYRYCLVLSTLLIGSSQNRNDTIVATIIHYFFSSSIIHYYVTHMHAKLTGPCSVSLDTRGVCSPSALKVHLWFYFSVWTKPSACTNELRVSISPDIQKQSMKFRHIEHKVVLVIYTSSSNNCSNLQMDKTGYKENAVMKPLIHEKVVKWIPR